MKVTDYIVDFLANKGVTHVFGVSGGAIAHFFDSADRHPKVTPIFHHHEQAGAFAAEAYAKAKNGLGVCFCTTGPGGTNTLTGLAAAWLDSIPCVFISGQARLSHTTVGKKIRQLGTQQLDIISLAKPMTKYAVMIDNVANIRYELEKAVHIALSGRPGPVWIDVPLDFQWSQIEPDKLKGFTDNIQNLNLEPATADIEATVSMLNAAKRPVLLVGYGARVSNASAPLNQLLEKSKLPVLTTWGACDLIPETYEYNLGRPGMAGHRGANLAMQNADLLICVGSHLNIPVTGSWFETFAREAKVIMVDIDKDELEHRTVKVDLSICADAKLYLEKLNSQLSSSDNVEHNQWRTYCKRYRTYNQVREKEVPSGTVSHYNFLANLTERLNAKDTIVVDGGGTNVYIAFHSLKFKLGQRVILSTGLCSMGSGLPEAIGACFSRGQQRTICLNGDGSFQFNIQELQTIVHHKLPIKMFIFNNDGYNSIRLTQKDFLNANYAGAAPTGGLTLPDYKKVAQAYGIPAFLVNSESQIDSVLDEMLKTDGPALCEVITPKDQAVIPTQGFEKFADGTGRARPLEDMAPFLDRKEFEELMIVKPWSKL